MTHSQTQRFIYIYMDVDQICNSLGYLSQYDYPLRAVWSGLDFRTEQNSFLQLTTNSGSLELSSL
jgi:hypothetical protein